MVNQPVYPIISDDIPPRGGQTQPTREDGNNGHANPRADAALEDRIKQALWRDDVLRVTDYDEIDIHATGGFVTLRGHLNSTTNRDRVEKALASVDELEGNVSKLILDDELTLEVAASLAPLEHEYDCKFFTGISHGVVVLNGEVSSIELRRSAERCAAGSPRVRGVINDIRVTGVDLGLQDHRFLQPPIGKEINFRDGINGVVSQVVINPDTRRVIEMTLLGHFYTQPQDLIAMNSSDPQATEHLLVIPMSVMGHLTRDSGFLTIPSTEVAQYQQYDPSQYTAPHADWAPPYPYRLVDVLFPIGHRQEIKDVSSQASSTLQVEERVLSKELLSNDSLGG